MKIQWFISPILLLVFTSIGIPLGIINAQSNCIKAPDSVCIGDCRPVEYVDNNTANATYNWSISCGTISNPTLQNPHEACFLTSGNCDVTLITQEPGSAPETCTVNVYVRPLPSARFVLRTDSLCSGNCLGLRVDFAGTPPYVFQVRDTNGITTYRSGSNSTIISVCPTASQFFTIVNVSDAYCTNNSLQDFRRIKVFAPFKANIYQQYSKLCSSPPVQSYKWFECNTTNLVSTVSCFAPPKEDCYCAVLFNGFCYDTVCSTFKCNLDCNIDYNRNVFIGDKLKIKYKGNGGPGTQKEWTYTLDNSNYFNSTDDSLELVFANPGSYIIRLTVKEEICTSTCLDTIIVKSRPCECGLFNKNYIIKSGSNSNNCCYELQGEINSQDCFNEIKVLTNNGNITNIAFNGRAGWRLNGTSSQSFNLIHASGQLPTGFFGAASFCVENATSYTITVYYYFQKNGSRDSCKYQYVYTCSPQNPPCDSISSFLELQHTAQPSCCYLLRSNNNKVNYFNQVTVTINSGNLSNVMPTIGYNLINSSGQSVTLSHISGFIPTGFITPVAFCINGFNNPVSINVIYLKNSGNKMDTCLSTYRFYCPDDGTPKDNCCDSTTANILPVPNQNCCWNLTAFSTKSKCFSKICVTSNTGTFTGIMANSGWTASSLINGGVCFTPSGNFIPTGTITPGKFCISNSTNPIQFTVDFYDNNNNAIPDCRKKIIRECIKPATCNCDSLDNQVFQTSSNPGSCCHSILGTIPYSGCFTKMSVSVTSGSFTNITPATGYSIIGGGNSFQITHTSGHLPIGNITPATFCVTGSTLYTITVQYYYIDLNGFEQRCVFTSIFDCPAAGPKCSCDSLSTQINSVSVTPGLCCYNFTSHVGTSNCFTKISVSVSSGSFVNVNPASGYIINNQTANGFALTHVSGHIPSGNITPASFCVTGATIYTINIQYYYLDQNGMEQRCIKLQTFDCPPYNAKCNCDSLLTNIHSLSTTNGQCCYDFSSHISSSNCFHKITIAVNAGSIVNIIPTLGYSISLQNPNGFSLVHSSGHIPAGNVTPASFCITGATVYTITITYYYYDQNGMEQRCIKSQVFDCPPAKPKCNCDSLVTNIHFVNATAGQCCYDFSSYVAANNCFHKVTVAVNMGNIVNIVPAVGFNISVQNSNSFTLVHSSGSIPTGNIIPASFCITGAVLYNISVTYYYYDPNGIEMRCIKSQTFDCPPSNKPCSCDSIITDVLQTVVNPGLCCNTIQVNVPTNNCIAAMSISISNGTLVNVVQSPNFVIGNPTNTSFNIGYNSGFIPSGIHQPVSFCVSGATQYGVTISYQIFNNGVLDTCTYTELFNCKPTDTTAICDHGTCSGQRVWQQVGNLAGGIIYDLENYNCKLYAAGQFNSINNIPVSNLAEWNGTTWSNVVGGTNGPIFCMAVHNGLLYIGGQFTMVGNVPVNNIAAWNGINWSNVGGGVTGISPTPIVYSLLSTTNGLIVGGQFGLMGNNQIVNNIAIWNNGWSASFGNGLPYPISMLQVFNGDVYAGGAFFGNPYNNIARWNGISWNPLTTNGISLVNNVLYHGVEAGIVWNNELIIGGHFANADGLPGTQQIVRWNGTNFSSLSEGHVPNLANAVNDFIRYNGDLFVGGEYDQIGNTSALGVVYSSNSTWTSTNHPNKITWALQTYDSCGTQSCDLYSAGEAFVNRWVCITSTKNPNREIIWELYPNPTNGQLTIILSSTVHDDLSIMVKDVRGVILMRQNINQQPQTTLDISKLDPGLYFIELKDNQGNSNSRKIVKTN